LPAPPQFYVFEIPKRAVVGECVLPHNNYVLTVHKEREREREVCAAKTLKHEV
jgi:hypothetical protein